MIAPSRELATVSRIGRAHSDAPERLMREVRRYLTMALEFECGHQIELADAAGAVAANKLARVIRGHP